MRYRLKVTTTVSVSSYMLDGWRCRADASVVVSGMSQRQCRCDSVKGELTV